MIKDILGGGMFVASKDPVNCGCGCGCGTWPSDYKNGLDAGTKDAAHKYYNP